MIYFAVYVGVEGLDTKGALKMLALAKKALRKHRKDETYFFLPDSETRGSRIEMLAPTQKVGST